MIESNFGINWQALAVLANLQSRDGLECSWDGGRYRARVESAPWYNGRERGVVFYLLHPSGRQLNLAVFEHRVGDHICGAEWEGATLNPPTFHDLPEGRFDGSAWSEDWAHGSVCEAAEWVYGRLEKFWKSCERKAVA
jgi:hypothetical protein